ncbi:thiamine phosphate synthase [Xanthobacter pseudotagetidis]|uniref:thiamine phosphate synthase n=1 Tax=Xanthobacter pseudotagetidis TaxID=3119911 RepID=UPI003727E447
MLPVPPALLITDRSQAKGDLAAVVAAACAGGCRWISLREKDLPEVEQVALFARIAGVARPFGARVTLHGAAALARAAGADGVHLPGGSDAAAARALLGPKALVGLSLHSREEAAQTDAASLDYVTASPVFLTASKPGYGPALGLEGLAAFARACPVPVLALGGVGAAEAGACWAAGAAGLAVMGGVMRADDPATAFRAVAGPFKI